VALAARGLLLTLTLAALTACSGPAAPDPPGPDSPAVPTGIALQVVELTNAERTRAGLAVFRINARLGEAARIQAEQIAAAGRLDHVVDARYPRLEDRLDAAEYRWQAAGENLAFGQQSAAAVVAGWMQSPGHRANILHATFTEIGVAYLTDTNGRPYYVQVFGRPIP
jgi:uncharacterized protein YkwD